MRRPRGVGPFALVLGLALVGGEGHAAPGAETISIRDSVTGASLVKSAPSAPGAEPVDSAPPSASQSNLALAALDRKIADLDAEDEASKAELSALGAKLKAAHLRTLERGRYYYRLTRAGMLPVGGGFRELVSHAMRVERTRRALMSDMENERKLRERGADLAHGLERVSRDRIALASQRSAMDAARLALEDETRRQAAFDRAFATSSGASDYVPVYGGSNVGPEPRGGGFAASRGRLLFPLVGRSELHQARREGTDGPGLEMKTTLGAPVRAVFAGRVAFADRYGAYGRLVIVDHGDHYYSVSGNLATIDVKVGDELSAGERLGTVGDEGQGPSLYFEIRHATDTIPPGPWLGL